MGSWKLRRATRGEILFIGFLAVLLLLNRLSLLFDGDPSNPVLFWVVLALNLGFLGWLPYAYRRAPKAPSRSE
ncbi:hypothetical protein GCM10027404_32850 [Arthrobacter tumbae]|nr:hypothetical protein [Arthrobacter tumbae]